MRAIFLIFGLTLLLHENLWLFVVLVVSVICSHLKISMFVMLISIMVLTTSSVEILLTLILYVFASYEFKYNMI